MPSLFRGTKKAAAPLGPRLFIRIIQPFRSALGVTPS